MNLTRLFYVVTYLAIGLLLHMYVFGSGYFFWSDPYLIVHVLLWPLFVAISFVKWVVIAVVAALVGVALWEFVRRRA